MFTVYATISRPKSIKKHYISDHKINTANWFLKALFKQKKDIYLPESTIGVKPF